LFQQHFPDSALQILQQLSSRYPASNSLDVNMYAMLMKQKKYENAYLYINKMIAKDKSNEDYFNEKLELCIILKKYTEACDLLTEVKDVYDYDIKIFKAHCAKEFINVPFQHQTKYVWKINQNGESFQVSGTVDASNSAAIKWNYQNTGKAANKGYYIIGAAQFDTSRVIDANYLNTTRNIDSTTKIVTWLSKQCYTEIENNQQTLLDIGNGLGVFSIVQIDESESDNFDANTFTDRIIAPNGEKKLIETYHLLNAETNEQIWILKNKSNPLIVKMIGNYTMELSEVSKQ
jgi:hypothetical protein